MPSKNTNKCARCASELGEGVTYCVVCGHANTDATSQRSAEMDLELDSRRERLGIFRRIAHLFWFLRRT